MANFQEIKNLSAGALNAFFLPSTDVSGFKWVSIHFNSSTLNGSLSFLGSNDGVNFIPVNMFRADTLSTVGNSFVFNPVGQIWHGPLFFRYFAIQCQAYTSGSISGLLELYESPGWYWQNVLSAGSNQIGFLADAGTSTLTNVNAAVSSTQLLAANTARKNALFYNDSTAILYLAYAGAASTTSYTTQVQAQQLFEMPSPMYSGAIFGIWSAANGAVRITELT